jgi:tetratricopeptide (TPR) repeat protein
VTGPVIGLLQRALTALGEDDSALRAQLLGRLAIYSDAAHHKPLMAREAMQMARRVADKATLAEVLISGHWATHDPDTLRESVTLTRELGRLADEVGDSRLRALAYRWLLDHLLELGDIDGVERELEALQLLADARRDRYIAWLLAVLRANRAQLGERLEHCEMLAHEALAHGFEGHDETAAQMFGVQMLFVRREQGRLVELVETVEILAAHYPQVSSWRCGLVSLHAQLERTGQAREELEALAREDFADLPRDIFWLSSLSALCEVVVFLGDAPRAQLLYDLLLPYADRFVVTIALVCRGSVSRPLGLLATMLSRFDDAARHFEHALEMNAQIRSSLWIAHTQCDYGYMLLLRNHSDDHHRALELLDRALDTADQLGLKALADKVRALKLAAEAPGLPPALTRPA